MTEQGVGNVMVGRIHHLRRAPAGLAVVISLALVVAACSSSKKAATAAGSATTVAGTASTSGGSATTSGAGGDPVADAKAKMAQLQGSQTFPSLPPGPTPKANQKIFIIGVDYSLEGIVRQSNGVEQAAKELGWTTTKVDGKSSPDAMAAGITRAVSEKANGIIMVTVNSSYVASAVAQAKAAGIKIVTMTSGSPVGGANGVDQEIVTVDYNTAMGKTQGDYVVADSDGKANALVFNDTSFTTAPPISQGAYDEIKACSTCKVQPMINFVSTDLATKFSEQVRTALVNNPNVNYVVTPYDAAATFASQGVRDAGKANSVKVVSTGGNLSNLDSISKGDIQTETSAEPLEYFGWLSVDAINRAENSASQIPFSAPVKILVKSNLPAAGQPWTGDSDFRPEFQKIWGK
jgi:ribose transport system substrate-binding protein